MEYKLLIAFDKLGEPNFLAKAQRIAAALLSPDALADFPDPWPAAFPARADVAPALATYEAAYAASLGGREERH